MKAKLVPPDGGWGWLIVVAYATHMICTIPVVQAFGLLFKGICADLGMSATDISVIISINSSFGMLMGLLNGPILRNFAYRKVAITGAILFTSGLLLTACAKSFVHFIFSYGVLCSLGMAVMNSAFSLALNSYFVEKRGRAVGFAMTVIGLGPILMPQFISVLMSQYGAEGAVLILGAVSLHAFAGALVLQPIAWHMKKKEVSTEEAAPKSCDDKGGKNHLRYISTSCKDLPSTRRTRTLTMSSIDHDVDTGHIYGFDTPVPRKKSTTHSALATADKKYKRSRSQYDPVTPVPPTPKDSPETPFGWWSSGKSLETINLGSSIQIFDETRSLYKISKFPETIEEGGKEVENESDESKALVQKTIVKTPEGKENGAKNHEDHKRSTGREKSAERKKLRTLHRVLHAIVIFFDFDLLRDPVYVNIMIGLSIAIFGEINFALLTPFILGEMKFTIDQIATVMSCLAIADLLFRGIAPFIAEWLKQPPRMMFLFSMVLLIMTRSSLLFVNTYASVAVIGFTLGIAKGIRTVFMTLVISTYVPIERLASASGIQMVINGLVLMIMGPILGIIKDKSGSYRTSVIFINGMTALMIAMWTIEIIVRKSMAKSSESATDQVAQKSRTSR